MPQPTPSIAPEPKSSIPPQLLPMILSSLGTNPLPSSAQSTNATRALSDATLLTTLALQPTLVLPPGKTLGSILSQPSSQANSSDPEEQERERKRKRLSDASSSSAATSTAPPSSQPASQQEILEQRISKMMKLAFWDDARDRLLSSSSAVSTTRLVALRADLARACSGLLGPQQINHLIPSVPGGGADISDGFDVTGFANGLMDLVSPIHAHLEE